MTVLVVLALVFSLLPACLYLANIRLFSRPRAMASAEPLRVSVLIPARNEEHGIAACLESILASVGLELEVVVQDDQSTDQTAEIVRQIATRDPRVRLESGIPLPQGWCGKQHACWRLAQFARHDIITFLDADVRLTPDALARMAGFLHSSGAALVSGFPRQETGTLLEKLIIPLINWLLLGFLPIVQMRKSLQVGLGAGCGQWFMTTKPAYEQTGGHSHPLVRGSLHDGIKLPRAYRLVGLKTDFCDATDMATCRMYRSASQVWNGFAKNAREGLGAPRQILIWTIMLVCGQVLPFALLPFVSVMESWQVAVLIASITLSILPRLEAAVRFRQSWLGALLHPLGILMMLSIQWYANARALFGRPVGWKGREHPTSLAS